MCVICLCLCRSWSTFEVNFKTSLYLCMWWFFHINSHLPTIRSRFAKSEEYLEKNDTVFGVTRVKTLELLLRHE